MDKNSALKVPLLPGVLALVSGMIYLAAILRVESERIILVLLAVGAIAVFLIGRFDFSAAFRRSFQDNERVMDALSICALIVLAATFYNNSFVLFLLTTVFVYIIACLGLNLQFGYAGMLNFAG